MRIVRRSVPTCVYRARKPRGCAQVRRLSAAHLCTSQSCCGLPAPRHARRCREQMACGARTEEPKRRGCVSHRIRSWFARMRGEYRVNGCFTTASPSCGYPTTVETGGCPMATVTDVYAEYIALIRDGFIP